VRSGVRRLGQDAEGAVRDGLQQRAVRDAFQQGDRLVEHLVRAALDEAARRRHEVLVRQAPARAAACACGMSSWMSPVATIR
jgi:hypothetical protein